MNLRSEIGLETRPRSYEPVSGYASHHPKGHSTAAVVSPEGTYPGLLRVLIVFHETEILGAGTSVVRVLDDLRSYGWSPSGWFPGEGPLVGLAETKLEAKDSAPSPIAWSRRGWREAPGVRDRIRRTPAYLRAFRAALVRTQPHVVHANTLLTLPEALIAHRCGLPVVIQSHELPQPGAKLEATLRLAARTADVLVGVSEPVSAMLRRRAGSVPVITVNNGVPMSDRRPSRPEDPFVVGTIGTVSRVKGTDLFLKAARLVHARHPDVVFEHVGSPDLHRDAGLDDEISALLDGFAGSAVRMRGTAPGQAALRGFGVFVSCSRSDAFPLATLEAMAAGIPVIATDVGGLSEQIEHLVTGILVPPDDPEAIAGWIGRLRDEPALAQALGTAAAERVRTAFSLERQAAGLHRAYLTALDTRFAPPPVRRQLDIVK